MIQWTIDVIQWTVDVIQWTIVVIQWTIDVIQWTISVGWLVSGGAVHAEDDSVNNWRDSVNNWRDSVNNWRDSVNNWRGWLVSQVTGRGHLISGGGVAPFLSEIVAEVIKSGGLEAHLKHLQEAYRARCEVLCDAIRAPENAACGWTLATAPAGGYFAWVRVQSTTSITYIKYGPCIVHTTYTKYGPCKVR
jgi:hypothetical protein